MWVKSKNILTPNYITVENKSFDLHFYVTGNSVSDVENVSSAIEDLMNEGKKSSCLKKNIVMNEVVLLENLVKVGVAGQVKKIKKEIGVDELINNDRIEFLQEFIAKMK